MFDAALAALRESLEREPDLDVAWCDVDETRDIMRRDDDVPREIRELHTRWRFSTMRMKLGRPRPETQHRPSPQLFLRDELARRLLDMRYELERARDPSPCDCAIHRKLKLGRMPNSDRLAKTGSAFDGYYTGDAYRCGHCGRDWWALVMDDDAGSWSWGPPDPPPVKK